MRHKSFLCPIAKPLLAFIFFILSIISSANISIAAQSTYTVRMSNIDDIGALYVNGQLFFTAKWAYFGVEPSWYYVAHQQGDSGWFDITPLLVPGDNSLRFTLWNKQVCCSARITVEVKKDEETIFFDSFNKTDSSEGIKYDKTISINFVDLDAFVAISKKTDFNNDRDIDGSDLSVFLSSYGSTEGDGNYNLNADFDGDGDVDKIDFTVFLRMFGSTNSPIILNDVPILNQEHYTNSIYEETYVDSVGNIQEGGCVPVSFAMLFSGHYNEFGPITPPADITYNSQNMKNLMDDITQKISIPIPPTEWQAFKFWTVEETKIYVYQVLNYMDNYSFTFDTNDYFVEAAWNIDYECSTEINNDQLIINIIERLNNNEPIFFMGHMNMNDTGGSGGHAAIITGYAKVGGIEYFRVNDTYSNISAQWYKIEKGDVCVVHNNCSPNYCPIRLVGKDGDWIFEMRYHVAWPQSLVFTVLPKY